MAYPYTNAMNAAGTLGDAPNTGSPTGFLAGGYPLFQVSSPVDVTGLEFAIAGQHAAGTALLAAQATAANTVHMYPYDGTTTASGVTGNNPIVAVASGGSGNPGFSNANAGVNSWTGKHNATKYTGTSTTDLDADDWVNLDVGANVTGAGGFSEIAWTAFFVHGVPGAVA